MKTEYITSNDNLVFGDEFVTTEYNLSDDILRDIPTHEKNTWKKIVENIKNY